MRLVLPICAFLGILAANTAAAHPFSSVVGLGSRAHSSNEFLTDKPFWLLKASRSGTKIKVFRPNHETRTVERPSYTQKQRRVARRKVGKIASQSSRAHRNQRHGRKLTPQRHARGYKLNQPTRPALQHEANASYYGRRFEGRRTASGSLFSNDELTAASPNLPLGTKVQVTNKETGRRVLVEVTDRMSGKRSKAIDLSERAAKQIGIKEDGTAPVRITVLE